MAFGVYDGLHPGHIGFLKQARRFGDELIVVVSRDRRCKAEGKCPKLNERERRQLVAAVRFVDRAVLGDGPKHYLDIIRRFRPNVVVVGYDQPHDIRKFRGKLAAIGLRDTRVVRLRKVGRHHSSSLRRKT